MSKCSRYWMYRTLQEVQVRVIQTKLLWSIAFRWLVQMQLTNRGTASNVLLVTCAFNFAIKKDGLWFKLKHRIIHFCMILFRLRNKYDSLRCNYAVQIGSCILRNNLLILSINAKIDGSIFVTLSWKNYGTDFDEATVL